MTRTASVAKGRFAVAATLLVGLVLRGDKVMAEETGAAEPPLAAMASKLTDEGFRLYKARDYRHASEKFLQAYAVDDDPNLLFNIARCYEALGNNDGAIEKYETFMARPESDPQGKRRAADAVRALRQIKAGPAPTGMASGSTRAVDAPNVELAKTGRGHVAGANGRDRYAELSGEGLAFYKAHDYNRGAERFLQAYALDPDPNLLFNIARCYAALGDSNAAIEKYEAYLKAPGTEPKGREQATMAMRALRETPRSEPPFKIIAAPSDSPHSPPEATHGASGRIVVGWVATGVLAAGAAVTGLLALESARNLKTARDTFPGNGPDISSQSSRTTRLTLSTDGLAIAAAVMAGVSLYWTLGGSPSTEVREVHAAVGPQGFRIGGSF